MANKIVEIQAAESWYIWRDEIIEKILLSVIFVCETSLTFLNFFCIEENQGIILTIPFTGTFILLNEYITCITLENSENNNTLGTKMGNILIF